MPVAEVEAIQEMLAQLAPGVEHEPWYALRLGSPAAPAPEQHIDRPAEHLHSYRIPVARLERGPEAQRPGRALHLSRERLLVGPEREAGLTGAGVAFGHIEAEEPHQIRGQVPRDADLVRCAMPVGSQEPFGALFLQGETFHQQGRQEPEPLVLEPAVVEDFHRLSVARSQAEVTP
jgi:hypothetical protein